jgi:hypothetical protein
LISFLHPVVFKGTQVVNLNKIPKDALYVKGLTQEEILDHSGDLSTFENSEDRMKFQKGLLDLKTFSDRDISKYDYERALDFLNTKILPASLFGFNNLCMVQQDNLNFEVEKEINQSFASCADYVKKKKTIFKNK